MPTKNTAKSNSKIATTKKSNTKKTGFLKRINFSSRKTQVILSTLVIAVAGAGFLTYQSFAATGNFTYTVANGGLKPLSNSNIIDGKTGKGKNGESIVAMPASVTYGKVGIQPGGVRIPASQLFLVCVVAKSADGDPNKVKMTVGFKFQNSIGAGNGYFLNLGAPGAAPYNNGLTMSNDLGNGYRQYCTTRPARFNAVVDYVDLASGTSSATIYVSSFTIKFVQ